MIEIIHRVGGGVEANRGPLIVMMTKAWMQLQTPNRSIWVLLFTFIFIVNIHY